MVIAISECLGAPASVLEIHPGDRGSSYEDLLAASEYIVDEYGRVLGQKPLILLENRTDQLISTGKTIAGFWEHLSSHHPRLRSMAGVVLDAQQLYTKTRPDFMNELSLIPPEAVRGLHIHHKHRVPNLSDEIPWRHVFDKAAALGHDIIINPEIHHKNRVGQAISFCAEMLMQTRG